MSILPKIDPEFKDLIPPLSPEEREQLEQNITSSRKCYDPIVLWEGTIIDGHNRYEICTKHGIEFQFEEILLESRQAAKIWILENQLNRRNLNDAARIEIALQKEEILREKAQRNLTRGGRKGKNNPLSASSKPEKVPEIAALEPIHVQKMIAGEAGVSEGNLYNYLQIKEHGSPALLAKVQSGELKIGTAHRLLEKELLKQLRQGDKLLKYIKKAMPEEGYKAAAPDIHERLVNLHASISNLLDKLEGK